MRRLFAVCTALLLLTALPLSSAPAHQEQAPPSIQQRYERSLLAWDEGRYIEARGDLIDVLESADGDTGALTRHWNGTRFLTNVAP